MSMRGYPDKETSELDRRSCLLASKRLPPTSRGARNFWFARYPTSKNGRVEVMATQPVITVDLAKTRSRIKKLRRYVNDNLLAEDKFLCSFEAECRKSLRSGDVFREGTMSHVGRHFDLHVGGKPLRIVVVGQESGFPKDAPDLAARATLDARYAHVHNQTGVQQRYYKTNTHKGRNPHMRGTTSALRILMGNGVGDDFAGENIQPTNGKPFHVYDGFALVNRLLCSAGPPNSSNGRPTPRCSTIAPNTLPRR